MSGEVQTDNTGESPNLEPQEEQGRREPVFNLPGIIVVLITLFVVIHLVREYALDERGNVTVIWLFAFIPASYTFMASQMPVPVSGLWSPLSHGFLHGDWGHLAVNSIWMAAFGSPLAKRFGAVRFMVFTLVCMAAGALLHLLSYWGAFVPVIGASGAVSGYMGAAGRFAFNNMGTGARRGFQADGPALSLVESFTNRQFLVFAGVWMVINFIFGTGIVPISGQTTGIAWQAHIGGFGAGVLLFSLFDPVREVQEP